MLRPRRTLRALLYHRIEDPAAVRADLEPDLVTCSPALLDRQLRYLTRTYYPIDATELLAAVAGRHRLPARAVVVTFDDGYRDFLELALPVLKRHCVPAMLFVPTSFVDHPERTFWWDALWQMLIRTRRQFVAWPGPAKQTLSLSAPADCLTTWRMIAYWLKTLTPADRRAMLELLSEQLGISPEPTHAVLSWPELRSLGGSRISIASHSRTHEPLNQLDSKSLFWEIEGSRDDLKRELGACLPMFAYPNGNFSATVIQALSRAGFAAAFTTAHGASVLGRANPLALRRDDAHLSLLRFALKLAGPLAAARSRRYPMPAYAEYQ